MPELPPSISSLNISGTPFDIGFAAGRHGRSAVHRFLLPSSIWAVIKDKKHAPTVNHLIDNTQKRFPHIWQELQGLAEGLELPIQDVAAWNCRGDILASTPDGCTTVVEPGPSLTIAHNEDGLPFFRGHCFMLHAKPHNETPFTAFCYPGSLAGHTFGWNDAGLALTINNLRLNEVVPDIPRMVLARAIITSVSLKDAITVLTENNCSGGFHMTLAESKSALACSVEFGDGNISIKPIETRSGHTNHALHLAHPNQTITASSKDRLDKLEQLIEEKQLDGLAILRDKSGPGLPIRRDDPNDPDEENTLATCVMTLSSGEIDSIIYDE